MTFKPLFGQFIILSLSFVNFRVSCFSVSHLTHETVKLCLQNTLNMSKMTRVYFGVLQTLLCSSVLRTCTWKIVFKIENNELNELSECVFYKMFFFSGKHLKTVKLTFIIIFQNPCLLTLKVSKAFLYLLTFKSL